MTDAPPPEEDGTVQLPRPGGRRGASIPVPAYTPPSDPRSQQEPDGDETVMIPAPGTVAPRRPDTGAAAPVPVAFDSPNPLLAAAGPLLALVPLLRATPVHADLEGLRRQLQQAIRSFEAQARQARVADHEIGSARYAICSLIDETIAGTPWGGHGGWAARSLLLTFHNEAWGGEKFFAMLDQRSRDAAAHIDLLELLFVCISLGFEGRYHQQVKAGGRAELDLLRDRLYELIRRHRPALERDLSPHWQGVADRGRRIGIEVPLWVIGAGVALLLAVLHIGFGIRLDTLSDPVFARIRAIDVAALAPPTAQAIRVTAPKLPKLSELLAPDITAGAVAVTEGNGRATVTIHGDGLFASGSATIDPAVVPVLQRIRDALASYPGTVLVTGHTDDQRIVSARFPSNWHLSLARAQSVAQLLATGADTAERFRAYGRGDTEPLVPNSSAENRARNRRVDITITGAAPG